MNNNNELKIAIVKQEVYQDLYVCPKGDSPEATLLSSIMRVGPIGLIADLNADFYIVNEENNKETQIYRKVIPHISPYLYLLKTQTADTLPGNSFKVPGSPFPNGRFAVDCHSVNWGAYDIVISVNISLPTHVVLQYPNTLFCYMIGEANMAIEKPRFGYDVSLNQMARGVIATQCGEVDFPYTFLSSQTLETIMHKVLGRPSRKKGVFIEINCSQERPVTTPPHQFHPLIAAGHEMILHKQNIKENLTAIYDSKYFVKMGGRIIRGNSVAEAISCGSLAIMDRSQVIHGELIIDECNVKNMQEVVNLITKLEADDNLYRSLVKKQRTMLQKLFYEAPLQSLVNCLELKRKGLARKYTLIDRVQDSLWIWFGNKPVSHMKSHISIMKKNKKIGSNSL